MRFHRGVIGGLHIINTIPYDFGYLNDLHKALSHSPEGAQAGDRASGRRAIDYLKNAADLPSLLAIYFPGPDNIGHALGRQGSEANTPEKSLEATKDHLLSEQGTNGQLKMLYEQIHKMGVQNAVIWLAVSDHGLMGTNRDMHTHPRPISAPSGSVVSSTNPLSGGLFSLRDGVTIVTRQKRVMTRIDYRSEMEVFFRQVLEENPELMGQDDTTNRVWYDRSLAVDGVPESPVNALWKTTSGVDAIYSPDGGLAHIYVREAGGPNWEAASGLAGTRTRLLAWYLAQESIGDFSHFPGGKPLMPKDVNNSADGSQFQNALAFTKAGTTAAGVFVLVGGKYQLAVPGSGLGEITFVDIDDNEDGGASWKLLKTRLVAVAKPLRDPGFRPAARVMQHSIAAVNVATCSQ